MFRGARHLHNFFRSRKVIITGHSGFKGSWLSLWLSSMGARVIGISLPPEKPALFAQAQIANHCENYWLDIRDYSSIAKVFEKSDPDLVFHLAAQSLVRPSYRDPIATFSTNTMGTANVLEAARKVDSIQAFVCVTTDKVYENRGWSWPFREIDPLGGLDPYSASKSAAELIARSYMTVLLHGDRPLPVATARGGNLIGGGDWSAERIVPDVIRSIARQDPLVLRNPLATRPWQHVLELCFGYLLLAMRLEQGGPAGTNEPADGAWNFGPDPTHELTVQALVGKILSHFGQQSAPISDQASTLYESKFLRLDSSKAREFLDWRPLLSFDQTVEWTASWYKRQLSGTNALTLTEDQIRSYERLVDSAYHR